MAKTLEPLDYELPGGESCEALVFACIDWRFRRALTEFVEQELGIQEFDLLCMAGAGKNINTGQYNVQKLVFQTLQLSKEKHHAKRIVIVNHFDCAMYGGTEGFKDYEDEFCKQKEEMRKASGKVIMEVPGIEVLTFVATIKERRINFVPIV